MTQRQPGELPVDSDIDVTVPQQRTELRRWPWSVLSVISAGGAIGALSRYGLQVAFPNRPDAFPWATFGINVLGCLLIGALAVLVADVMPNRHLVRPFFGVGVLGGFTTFSTYAVDVARLADAGALLTAGAYLVGTLLAALVAAQTGIALTQRLLRRRP